MTEATAAVYTYRSDAEIAVARLAADGIPAEMRVENEGGLNPGFYREYGVRVLVAEKDLSDALDSLGVEQVSVPREIAEAMYRHAVGAMPNEACGLVASDDSGDLVFVACLTNADHSAHRFTIGPAEHHGMLAFCEARGWRIGGVFHSHTRSLPYPSASDIEGGADPDWLHFLVGPVAGKTELKAYRIDSGDVAEVSVTIES